MNSKYFIKICLIISLVVFVSCSEDEDNPIDPNNAAPRIFLIQANPPALSMNETTELTCFASDEDNDVLTYSWNSSDGNFPNGNSGRTVSWTAPGETGDYLIEISVSDNQDNVKDTLIVPVIDDPCEGINVIAHEGIEYDVIAIGKQCWMKENLNVGIMVNDNVEMTNQDTVEKYCYDNDPSNCDSYGGLYQWNEAMGYSLQENSQGICPPGWHIPSFNDFQTLKLEVNSSANALKSIGQGIGVGSGTNTSGFSALLAGQRTDDADFGNISDYGIFWSSTLDIINFDAAYHLYLNSENDDFLIDYGLTNVGISIRCIRD